MDLALDCRDYYGENELAADVLRSKYLAPNEQGPMHLWDRIARAVASVETDEPGSVAPPVPRDPVRFHVRPGRPRHAWRGPRRCTPPPHPLELLRHPDRRRQSRRDLPRLERIGHGLPHRRRGRHGPLIAPARRRTGERHDRSLPRRHRIHEPVQREHQHGFAGRTARRAHADHACRPSGHRALHHDQERCPPHTRPVRQHQRPDHP